MHWHACIAATACDTIGGQHAPAACMSASLMSCSGERSSIRCSMTEGTPSHSRPPPTCCSRGEATGADMGVWDCRSTFAAELAVSGASAVRPPAPQARLLVPTEPAAPKRCPAPAPQPAQPTSVGSSEYTNSDRLPEKWCDAWRRSSSMCTSGCSTCGSGRVAWQAGEPGFGTGGAAAAAGTGPQASGPLHRVANNRQLQAPKGRGVGKAGQPGTANRQSTTGQQAAACLVLTHVGDSEGQAPRPVVPSVH